MLRLPLRLRSGLQLSIGSVEGVLLMDNIVKDLIRCVLNRFAGFFHIPAETADGVTAGNRST